MHCTVKNSLDASCTKGTTTIPTANVKELYISTITSPVQVSCSLFVSFFVILFFIFLIFFPISCLFFLFLSFSFYLIAVRLVWMFLVISSGLSRFISSVFFLSYFFFLFLSFISFFFSLFLFLSFSFSELSLGHMSKIRKYVLN